MISYPAVGTPCSLPSNGKQGSTTTLPRDPAGRITTADPPSSSHQPSQAPKDCSIRFDLKRTEETSSHDAWLHCKHHFHAFIMIYVLLVSAYWYRRLRGITQALANADFF